MKKSCLILVALLAALAAASNLSAAPASRFVQDRFVIGMWVPPAK